MAEAAQPRYELVRCLPAGEVPRGTGRTDTLIFDDYQLFGVDWGASKDKQVVTAAPGGVIGCNRRGDAF